MELVTNITSGFSWNARNRLIQSCWLTFLSVALSTALCSSSRVNFYRLRAHSCSCSASSHRVYSRWDWIV